MNSRPEIQNTRSINPKAKAAVSPLALVGHHVADWYRSFWSQFSAESWIAEGTVRFAPLPNLDKDVYPVGIYPVGIYPVGIYPVGIYPVGIYPVGIYPVGIHQI